MSELTLAQELASGYISHFYAADHSLRWVEVEKEHSLWLDEHTLLLGRIDCQGLTEDGDHFFLDHKTISSKKKNRMGEVKAEYRLDPQMLTYGVLTSKGSRFCVRWAIKPFKAGDTPLYFHDWYTYTDTEIVWWRNMLINISAKIRADKAGAVPFVTNLTNCLRYGQAYACPFLEPACSKQKWDGKSSDMVPRESHLEMERSIMESKRFGEKNWNDCLILDATRIDTWLGCNERFRREYIENTKPAPGEALAVGLEFHEILGKYYEGLKEKQ